MQIALAPRALLQRSTLSTMEDRLSDIGHLRKHIVINQSQLNARVSIKKITIVYNPRSTTHLVSNSTVTLQLTKSSQPALSRALSRRLMH